MHRNLVRFAITLAVILHISSPSAAVLDQSTLLPQPGFPLGGMGGFALQPGFRTGQTFEVGVTGFLDRIDVQFQFYAESFPTDSAAFSIYAVSSDGLPIDQAIASAVLAPPVDFDPARLGHYTISLDFSGQGLIFDNGETYALVAETSTLSSFWGVWIDSVDDGIQTFDGDRYHRGSGIYEGFGMPWQTFDDDPFLAFDATFATYMTPVPLPASGWLLTSALVAAISPKFRSRYITQHADNR